MTKSETVKRYVLFIISLFFAALGVAFTKRGELGVSPISSVANVMSCKFDSLSLGMWMVSFIPADRYPVRLIMVIVGVVILGFGISLKA